MNPMRAEISEGRASTIASEIFGLDKEAEELNGELDRNFIVKKGQERFVLKIARYGINLELIDLWGKALRHLKKYGLPVPDILPSLKGNPWEDVIAEDGRRHLVWATTWLEGEPLVNYPKKPLSWMLQIGEILGRVQLSMREFKHPALQRNFEWDLRKGEAVCQKYFNQLPNPASKRIIHETLGGVSVVLDNLRDKLSIGPIHGDANDHNWIIQASRKNSPVTGLIDVGDTSEGWVIGEIAIACAYAMLDEDDPVAVTAEIVRGYNSVNPIPESELPALWELAKLRLCVSFSMSGPQQKCDPENHYLSTSAKPAIRLLDRLLRISNSSVLERLHEACNLPTPYSLDVRPEVKSLQKRREKILGPNMSTSYQSPLIITRGAGRFLFDDKGQGYLDAVNNVPHVGHCHPKVTEAAIAQIKTLNTNSRYLNEDRLIFAERLANTYPDPLSVVYLVNSGSEANELALRLAKAHTGGSDVVVIDSAYHGNTGGLVDLSPYKFNGEGGAGKKDHIQVATLPDCYRGEFGYDNPNSGPLYAEDVKRCFDDIHQLGHKPAAFLAESISGCGGQVIFPDEYLMDSFRYARKAGAVTIADEVQVGFGRVGSHFWAFETQCVIPDIVTMGKPIGNGHPLGAVITTPEIASSFDNGMEYFNTFGGNPLSCKIGNAVLDVIEEEALQENAKEVGEFLLNGLRELQKKYPSFGDARGLGLYLGLVCVKESREKEPYPALASGIVEAMRKRGVLLSVDGPLHDVIKIKPPLVFQKNDAKFLLHCLDSTMREIQ